MAFNESFPIHYCELVADNNEREIHYLEIKMKIKVKWHFHVCLVINIGILQLNLTYAKLRV